MDYRDSLISITEDKIIFKHYCLWNHNTQPWQRRGKPKAVLLTDIAWIRVEKATIWNGRWRIHGAGNFKTWFPRDNRCFKRDKIFFLKTEEPVGQYRIYGGQFRTGRTGIQRQEFIHEEMTTEMDILRGLKFSPNAEIGENSPLWMNTNEAMTTESGITLAGIVMIFVRFLRPLPWTHLSTKTALLISLVEKHDSDERRAPGMIKVKTFTVPLRIFQVRGKLQELDEEVNAFLDKEQVRSVVSVSDTHTTDDTGATIGLIRAVAYQV
jgi:hypothetical protein